MAAKRESVFVGLFVIVAAAVLIGMVFAITGALGGASKTYHAYFPFAGGLEQGATVRYAGGPKVGHVDKLTIDPNDPTRIDIVFSVEPNLPVKTDSKVRIMSLSPLGDNHLEILPGGAQAAPAKSGTLLPSEPYVDFNAILADLNDLSPKLQRLVGSLDDLTGKVKVTLDRANGFLSPENQANLSAALSDTHEMLKENRKPLNTAVKNFSAASEKIEPIIQDVHKTMDEANKALNDIDTLVTDNKDNVKSAVAELRDCLKRLTAITDRVDQTLDVNAENIDELLDNFRRVSQNLKEFTETIKKRPYTLIRASNPAEHKPGEQK